MEMSIVLLLKTLLFFCIPKQCTRLTEFRIEYKNNKRRRRRRRGREKMEVPGTAEEFCNHLNVTAKNSNCATGFNRPHKCNHHSFNFSQNSRYFGYCLHCGHHSCVEKHRMHNYRKKWQGVGSSESKVICNKDDCCTCGDDGNTEEAAVNLKAENIRMSKIGSDIFIGSTARIKYRASMERTRTSISFSSRCYHFLIVLALLGMCQVSEECPAVCECKWKSGKESVICSNAKTKLSEIPPGLDPGTQVLDLSGNSIKLLPANVFLSLNLLNLQKIFLSDCSLKSLDRLAFAKLKNLVELDLSGNRQEFVPSHAFSQIPELRELKINSNPISRISNDAFVDLSRLVRLELSGCRIGTIEIWAFRGLPALEWLRLDNNRLFAVQAISFFPLRSLHGLEIHGNPWNCSCALQPFREWMGKNNVPFGVPPVCSQPPRLTGKLWNELGLEDFACIPKLILGAGSGNAAASQQSSNQQKSRKILEGENTTLSCQWEATPDTKIRWWNGNKPIGTNGASGFTSGFLVSESFRWDPDDLSSSSRSGDSNPSSSSRRASGKTSDASSTALQSSSGKGKPRNHTFYDRGVGIKTSNLIVIRTTPRDSGTYTCRAESRQGSATANFTLVVVQNKAEHLTGRFLLFGAVLAALLTLVVSLLLVCVVFGSNSRRHYQSSRIATDDKLELNHVGGETHIVGQNGGGRVPLMGNHHNSHHHRHNNNSSNHHSGTAVTTNSILSRRTMSNGENNCGSGGAGGAHDKGKAYKALPTMEPDDSSSELENNGSDLDDCGEVDQDGNGGVGIGIAGGGGGGIAISTKAIVSSSSTGSYSGGLGGSEPMGDGARSRNSNGPQRQHQQQQQIHSHHHQQQQLQQQQFPLVRKPGVPGTNLQPSGEAKIGPVLPEAAQHQRTSPSHGHFLSSPPQSARNNETVGASPPISTVMANSGTSATSVGDSSNNITTGVSASSSRIVGDGGVGIGIGPSGSASKLFSDKYPDLIDEKMSLGSDFASLPRPNKNQQQHLHHQLPYKHYTHQKHHLVDSTVRGYFHRRNNSDSQSPLLSRSYGNSTEKITSSGISILSSSSTESSYVSTYQPPQPPYTITQGHHSHHLQQQHHPPPSYRGSFKGSQATMNYHQTQHHNPFLPSYSSSNYPTRQRLSMPTSPVHDHYFVDHAAPSVGAMRHHSGSHDEGRNGGGLLSPADQGGISYVRTASSGPVGSVSNVSYDYHAAQLAAFLEEYRQLQLELMRMSASLQQGGGTETGVRSGQQSVNSPPSDSSSMGNSNSTLGMLNNRPNDGGTMKSTHHHELSSNVNNTSVIFKSTMHPHSTQGNSPQQQHQLKSILKNSGNNNNYVA